MGGILGQERNYSIDLAVATAADVVDNVVVAAVFAAALL